MQNAIARLILPLRWEEPTYGRREESVNTLVSAIQSNVSQLEKMNPTERPAASPLIDGQWKVMWASSRPQWIQQLPLAGQRITHLFDLSSINRSGTYKQKLRLAFLLAAEVEGECSALGGDHLHLIFGGKLRISLLGITIARRDVEVSDLDHSLQLTFLDGDTLILRAPPVCAGSTVLRPERTYLLSRLRHAFWQPTPEEEPTKPSWLPDA